MRTLTSTVLLIALAALAGGARAAYPDRPIRIVTTEPGGGSDFSARLIAEGLSASMGQQVIVDNRSGVLPTDIVSKAAPDGYTLLSHGTTVWIDVFLRPNVGYDPIKSFTPISLLISAPTLLVVPPSLPVNSVKELIALAKGKPGQLNYGTGPIGSIGHLAGELFKSMAGVNIVRVTYKGNGPAVVALIGNEIQMMMPSAAAVTAHVKAGRLKALAVTSLKPSALVPGLPTVSESGLPGFEAASISGILGPGGMPRAIVDRLYKEIVEALNRPGVKQKLFDSGTEAVGNTPEEFQALIRRDMDKWGKVIRDSGIKIEER
jgi:tripartite-type tricarboxylate transporter receptor subunit TctC